jgi:NAD+ synthase
VTPAGDLHDRLHLDATAEAERIESWIREIVHDPLRRQGAVVGVSGGIDSSVVLALCARALGPERVLAVLSPEQDSAPDTLELSRSAVEAAGTPFVEEDITEPLAAFGCYRRRDEAVREVIPEYTPEWKMKIVLPPVLGPVRLRIFTLVAESPGGERVERRLPAPVYRAVVAAMNFKQRTRKALEYHHADRLGYAVAGTPNRLEYDQGFFVKNGDGAADFKPIAHLYKSQVYELAEVLDVPETIRTRVPTTDTYSLAQTQEEFFFSLPLETLDLLVFASDHGVGEDELAAATGLDTEQVRRAAEDVAAKRRAAHYLHLAPLTLDPR